MRKLKVCSVALLALLLVGCTMLFLACENTDPCAQGHTEVTDAAVAATCTSKGLSEGKHCSVCNKVLTKQEPTDTAAHTAGEWVVTLAACGQKGSQHRKCTVCDIILEIQVLDASEHQYGEPELTKPATCTEDGEQRVTCTGCNDVKITKLSALAHEKGDWKPDPAKPATCTQNGLEIRACTRCSVTLEVRTAQKTAHAYPENWTITLAPTCSVMGQKQRTCTACGYAEEADLPTTAHTPGAWTTVLEATLTTDGSKTQECTTCHNIIKLEIIPAENAPSQLIYTVSQDKATVTGYTARASKVLVIPEALGGYPVVKIAAGAFRNATRFTSITLPTSLEQIEEKAFEGCTALTSVNGLSTLGDWLIAVDTSLREITVPAAVKKIASGAFANCRKLVHITNLAQIMLTGLPENAGLEIRTSPTEAFQNKFATENGITTYTVGSTVYLFAYTSDADTLDLSKIDIDAIYPHALLNNATLKSLVIPETLTDIGENAFGGCAIEALSATVEGVGHVPTTHLKKLVITGSPIDIPSNFLNGCITLEDITIPSTVLVKRKQAFEGCDNVTTLTAPANMLTSLPLSNLKKLTVNGGTTIPANAFKAHPTLKEVHIAPSVTTINAMAFFNCYELEIFVFDDIENSKLTTLANYIFCSDKKLRSIILPEGLTNISGQCFSGCSGLTEINIPSTVTYIAYEAFQNCTGLTSITIPASVTMLENRHNSNDMLSNKGGVFKGCTNLESVIFEPGSKLTQISSFCFYGCASLTSITIPASVTTVGTNAFTNSGVTSVTFENTSNWKAYAITSNSQIVATGFQNLGTGTAIAVTEPTDNAINFTSSYKSYTWMRP